MEGTRSQASKSVALIIEDDLSIRKVVRVVLQKEGWTVFEAENMRQGLIQAGTRRPDVILLDLGLPDGHGLDCIHDLRSWSAIPIIVLSAQDMEADKIVALDAGADDYLTKPFSIGELAARVRAAKRRSLAPIPLQDQERPLFSFGEVQIDLLNRTVSRPSGVVHLTPLEYRLLVALVTNAGKVLTHRQLLTSVWGPSHANDRQYLRVYMTNLRKKLEQDPAEPRHLLTDSAVGYRLAP